MNGIFGKCRYHRCLNDAILLSLVAFDASVLIDWVSSAAVAAVVQEMKSVRSTMEILSQIAQTTVIAPVIAPVTV